MNEDGDGPAGDGPASSGSTGDDPADPIDALLSAYALKDVGRTGWQLRGVADPESVAAHAWGVGLLWLVYGPRAGIDVDRALRLAVVHDLAEARTGDPPTRADDAAETVDAAEKERRERAAIAVLTAPLTDPDVAHDATGADLDTEATSADSDADATDIATDVADAADAADPAAALWALWEEYEARETPEAVFVKEMDLIDTCLQALLYERANRYDPADGDPDAFREYDDLDEFFATAESRLRTDLGRELFERIRARYEAIEAGDGGEGGDAAVRADRRDPDDTDGDANGVADRTGEDGDGNGAEVGESDADADADEGGSA